MRITALLSILCIAFWAGCADDGGSGDGTGTDDTGHSDHLDGTGTDAETDGGDEPTENAPPTATLSATIEQGIVPFDVTFELDAADADGDPLDWSLDADGDGLAEATGTENNLPGNFTFTYTDEGLYTANFTVSDGTNETVRSLTINGTAAAAGTPGQEAVVHSGSVLLPDPFAFGFGGCLFSAAERDASPEGGTWGVAFPVEESQWGWDYSFDVEGVIAEYWDDEPNLYGSDVSGQIPAGATYVVVCIDSGDADIAFQLTFAP